MITVTANPTSIRLVMGDLWHTDLTMEQALAFRSELDAAIRELRGGQFVPDVDARDEAFHQNNEGVESLIELFEEALPAPIEVETAYGNVKHWQIAERPAPEPEGVGPANFEVVPDEDGGL